MVQYTPRAGIPYPDMTDTVKIGSRDLVSLAMATDAGIGDAIAAGESAAGAVDARVTSVDSSIRADMATQIGSAKWQKGTLPTGTDANQLIGGADSGMWTLSSSATYTNIPVASGMLVVEGTSFSGRQVAIPTTGAPAYERTLRNFSQRAWTDWGPAVVAPATYVSGVALDSLRSTQDYVVQSQTVANSIPDWPSDVLGRQPAVVSVKSTTTGLTSQKIRPLYSLNVEVGRVTSAISPTPYPFGPWKNLAAGSSVDAGLANSLLVQDFTRRHGGARKTGGKGAFAFRCDHGLTNVRDIVLPLLEARGIKPSIALNSRNWSYPENVGVDAAMVDGWVSAGKVEVWNHGATHGNATTPALLEQEIVTGLAELRAQLPSAQIDGWVVPGVSATDPYMGFNNGQNVQQFYGTEAGRMILANHAVSTGYIPGTHQVTLDGTVRQGGHQFTIDSQTLAAFQAEVDYAITHRTGLQVMLHPSQIGLSEKITAATLTAMLDYAAAKRDAGDLVFLSPYEMVSADSR